jgi:pimeloyl-ACP methyl ester carboxylesterase
VTTVVFIPGILGSKLALGDEEVWPPKATEVVLGYGRIDKLVAAAVVSTGVIESQCIPVYGPIMDALRDVGIKEENGADILVPWHYDWRKDLAELAEKLSADLKALAEDHPGNIVLLCHSMGGLIARYCMEYQGLNDPWQDRIRLAIFMATPHEGAPLAIARATGTGGSSLGLNAAQLRQLCGAPGYPADYQLCPAQAAPVIWRTDALLPFAPQSLGDPGVAAHLGLNQTSLDRSFDFQSKLDPTKKPAARRYFSIVSAAHETITRFDGTQAKIAAVAVKNAGDGTVPIQSAAALHDQTAFVIADHMGVAKNDTAIDIVLMLLEKKEQGPVVAAAGAIVAEPTLSLSQSFIAQNEDYEIVIARPPDTQKLNGKIFITRNILEAGAVGGEPIQALTVVGEGPELYQISLSGPNLSPGLYSFSLETDAGRANSRPLVVSPALANNLVNA